MRQQKYEQALRDILEQVNLLNARTVAAANPRAADAPALDELSDAYSVLILIRTIAAEALER